MGIEVEVGGVGMVGYHAFDSEGSRLNVAERQWVRR